jgi:predicted RNase H-like HicB family nuclease
MTPRSEPNLRGYPVILYREPEDGSWSVMAPDLPGHIGAAMTIPEALISAADAMTSWISVGPPVPPPSDPHEWPRPGRAVWEAGEPGLDAALERVRVDLIREFRASGSYNRTAIWQGIERVFLAARLSEEARPHE